MIFKTDMMMVFATWLLFGAVFILVLCKLTVQSTHTTHFHICGERMEYIIQTFSGNPKIFHVKPAEKVGSMDGMKTQ